MKTADAKDPIGASASLETRDVKTVEDISHDSSPEMLYAGTYDNLMEYYLPDPPSRRLVTEIPCNHILNCRTVRPTLLNYHPPRKHSDKPCMSNVNESQQRRYVATDWWNVDTVRNRVSEKYSSAGIPARTSSILHGKRHFPLLHPPMCTLSRPMRKAHRTEAKMTLHTCGVSHDNIDGPVKVKHDTHTSTRKRDKSSRARERSRNEDHRDCADQVSDPTCLPKLNEKRKSKKTKKKKRPKAAHHSRRSSIPSLPPIFDKMRGHQGRDEE
ncbi:uncharacterized protein [Ptychodera flava]|uniref:uncharacterized protein n=1 Tax=Ptychodera flava TaxID=63121 RepID=UPI003969EFC7